MAIRLAANGTAPKQALTPVIQGSHPHGSYSVNELAILAMATGFPRQEVPRAAGIMFAESAGDPNVTSPNPGGGLNVGLAQIQQATAQGVGRSGEVRTLQDPIYNVRTMYLIWKRYGWGKWATYTSGAYVKYMNQVSGTLGPKLTGKTNPDPFGSGGAIDNAAGGVAAAASAVPDFLGHLGVIFQGGFWLRVLQGFGGLALILLGLVMAARGMTIGAATKVLTRRSH